jgi:pimeloyl-ACP methyl ester carboxylesterase
MHWLVDIVLVLVAVLAACALLTWWIARWVRATFRPPGQFIEVAGERIHYRSLGQGPAIVFVHGLGGQSRNFDYLPLEDLARRWRLVLLDRPGSGHSPRNDDRNAALAAQARIVAAFIRAMEFERPPLLVGHSLGGAIGLGVALHDPQCISGLALIAPLTHFTPVVPPPFEVMAIRSPALRRFVAHTLAVPLSMVGARRVLHVIFGPDAAPRDFPVRGGGLLGLRPEAFYAASTDLNAVEHDLQAQQQRYGEIRLPLWILYGDGDRVLDWRAQGEALHAKVPQSALRVIPGGHMIPVSAAAATAAWLEDAARTAHAGLCDSAAPEASSVP